MQYWSLPAKRFVPRMENIRKTASTTMPTLKIPPIEESKATTTVFMSELWEMNLKGRRIRRRRRILMIGILTFVALASIREVTTMKKSIWDQVSLR